MPRPTCPTASPCSAGSDEPTLADEYRRAWVFCLPSSYEGFGIPYAEAMTAGAAGRGDAERGARYVTDDGRFGILAELDEIAVHTLRFYDLADAQLRLGAASAGAGGGVRSRPRG